MRTELDAMAIRADLVEAGVPLRTSREWPDSDVSPAAGAREWWELETIHLLRGPVGTGKTRLAAALLARWIEAVRRPEITRIGGRKIGRPRFLVPREFLGIVQGGYSRGSDRSAMQLFDEIANGSALVLDDLGKESLTEDARGWLELLIDRRWGNLRPTIITTNLSHERIRETYGDRIASRLAGGILITMAGADHRLTKGKA